MTLKKKKSSPLKQDFKKLSFHELYQELQGITKAFEAGQFNLEESIKQFERGLKLAHECRQRLENAENKIKLIAKKFDEEKS